MERGAIFGFMAALAICLGLLGWHYYHMHPTDEVICNDAEAHCLERPYFN